MTQILKVLWPLLLIEAANFFLHRLLRPTDAGATLVDTVSLTITAAITFAAGWMIVSRRIGGIALAILAGVLIWAFSNLVLSAGSAVLDSAFKGSGDPEQRLVVRGIVTGALLLLPVAIAIAAVGGLFGKRQRA